MVGAFPISQAGTGMTSRVKGQSVIVGLPGKGLVGAFPISQAGTGMTSRVKGQSKGSLEECLVLTQELSYSKLLSPMPALNKYFLKESI